MRCIPSRNATMNDVPQLIELEKVWPESSRATEDDFIRRINRFPEGFFVAEDESGIIGSIIAHPYHYEPKNLSNFKSWDTVSETCYGSDQPISGGNVLYIVSGTSNKAAYDANFFNEGIRLMLELAMKLGLEAVVAGALLPGYANYLKINNWRCAEDYVFETRRGRCVDPLIEKYRRLGFQVPDKHHVIANYFPDENSLNYSALVLKNI